MTYYIQVGTTNNDEDRLQLRKAIGNLQNKCNITDGYLLGEPMSKFGWTFFDLILKPHLHLAVEEEFFDMIKKSKGNKPTEKFMNFLSGYFESKECKVKLKLNEFT